MDPDPDPSLCHKSVEQAEIMLARKILTLNYRYGSLDPDPHQNVTDPQHC
jgi:hypothetical protein